MMTLTTILTTCRDLVRVVTVARDHVSVMFGLILPSDTLKEREVELSEIARSSIDHITTMNPVGNKALIVLIAIWLEWADKLTREAVGHNDSIIHIMTI